VRRGKDVVEVQIRTWEHHMRTMAEPYWKYKKLAKDKEFEKELSWERQLIEWQKSNRKRVARKKKLGGRKIFAFTPKNEAIALPQGATTIDFAFCSTHRYRQKNAKSESQRKVSYQLKPN